MKRRASTPPLRNFFRSFVGHREEVMHSSRQHPFAIVGALGEAALWIAPLTMVAWGVSGMEPLRGPLVSWIVQMVFVAQLVVVARLIRDIVRWEFSHVIITDRKVMHVHGVLNRRMASTPVEKVSELTVNQTLLGRFLGYGSIIVDVPGGREQALHGLDYIPNPTRLYRMIGELADQRTGRLRQQHLSTHMGPDTAPTDPAAAQLTTVIDLVDDASR